MDKKNRLTKHKFEWQDVYNEVSVSETIQFKVRANIKNQEEHHRKKTFVNECIAKYGFEKFKG